MVKFRWKERQLTVDKTFQGLCELLLDLVWGPGQAGSKVTVGWVTGQAYSHEWRRLNVQSGLGMGQVKGVRTAKLERSRP